MDGGRHRQSYGNVITAAPSANARNHPRPSHHQQQHPVSGSRGIDTSHQQQSSSSRHSTGIQQTSQHPHPLQHSNSTVTGGREGRRETRRSISIPVIGDNRSGGILQIILCLESRIKWLILESLVYLRLNVFCIKLYDLGPIGGRPVISRQSSRSRLSPAERAIPHQQHSSLKFRHSHSGTLPTTMVGQVQMDPMGIPPGSRSNQEILGGMHGISQPTLHSGAPGNMSGPHEASMMMEHHHTKGLVPPRSPRMKIPPPTIISPSVIQRSPSEAVGSSMSRVPDNIGPALARLGKSIALSVEILATVGETIADENPDIRGDMLLSCRESRAQSTSLEKMCEALSLSVNISDVSSGLRLLGVSSNAKQTIISNHHGGVSTSGGGGNIIVPTSGGVESSVADVSSLAGPGSGVCSDLEILIRTLRQLLTAVTKILLLSDNVVVKQLLGMLLYNINVQTFHYLRLYFYNRF